jgi:hypothetical protein
MYYQGVRLDLLIYLLTPWISPNVTVQSTRKVMRLLPLPVNSSLEVELLIVDSRDRLFSSFFVESLDLLRSVQRLRIPIVSRLGAKYLS